MKTAWRKTGAGRKVVFSSDRLRGGKKEGEEEQERKEQKRKFNERRKAKREKNSFVNQIINFEFGRIRRSNMSCS